ncbi:MAG: porin [Pseudomonadota bacterium]
MKRSIIAVSVAAALALPMTAQAAPKIYGKLFMTVEQLEKDNGGTTADEDFVRLVSNDSRFGVKGEDELTATLSAVYQIEWEVQGDSAGDTTDMKQRNRFIGLKHQDFGTLKLGAYDTYLKQAQGKADFFNEVTGDMKFVIAGENRVSNVVGYESPKVLGGLAVNVMTQTQDTKDNKENAADDTNPKAAGQNGSSASIVYDNSDLGLYLAVAMDANMYDTTAVYGKRASDNLRAVAAYKLGDLTLAGVYNVSKAATGSSDNEEAGYNVGASYKLGDQVLKAQWGTAERDEATTVPADVQERTMWSVGVDHFFTTKTRALAFYTVKEEDKPADNNDYEETIFGLGIEHNF